MLGKTNSKAFWKEVKGQKSKQETPNIDFFGHFKNLAGIESKISEIGKEEIRQVDGQPEEIYIGMLDDPIELEELEGAIKSLKTDKSA